MLRVVLVWRERKKTGSSFLGERWGKVKRSSHRARHLESVANIASELQV